VDPGTSKIGLAVVCKVDGKTHIEERDVVDFGEFVQRIRTMMDAHDLELIVVGNGTNSKRTLDAIRAELPSMATLVVDERDTSIRARERYWEYTPRRGWRRLLPSSLLVPSAPIDDFAAAILAERVLSVD
jgi:RNase H-fold protein (predicted Holliday junction resolvase)